MAIGHAPWERWDPSTSERAYWYRFDDPPLGDDGEWDPLAVVALCDTMPGAVEERMGPDVPMWFGPSVDLTVHVLARASSPWLLAHNRARYAGDGYASAELSMWDPAPRARRLCDPADVLHFSRQRAWTAVETRATLFRPRP